MKKSPKSLKKKRFARIAESLSPREYYIFVAWRLDGLFGGTPAFSPDSVIQYSIGQDYFMVDGELKASRSFNSYIPY